jgi:hypothetical protein
MCRALFLLPCLSLACTSSSPSAPAGADAGEGGSPAVVLASGENLPGPITVAGGFVYWVNADGRARRAPTTAGAAMNVPTTVATGCKPVAIAADGASVYCGTNDQRIVAVPLDGGAPSTLAGAQQVSDLAVDAQRLSWTTYWGVRVAGGNDISDVAAIPLDGGAIQYLATGQLLPGSIVGNGSHAYWVATTTDASGKIPPHGIMVFRAPFDGGAAQVLASSNGTASYGGGYNKSVAVTASVVLWSNDEGMQILSAPLAGGPVAVVAQEASFTASIAADETSVYWVTTMAIRRAPVSGGAAIDVVTGEQAASIAIDATNVYWTNPSKGTVARAPR